MRGYSLMGPGVSIGDRRHEVPSLRESPLRLPSLSGLVLAPVRQRSIDDPLADITLNVPTMRARFELATQIRS